MRTVTESERPSIATRLATIGDVPALTELIPLSARELSRGYYTDEQTEAAIRYVFGPDTLLINDRTYFVAEEGRVLAGCGGWSRRRSLFGADQMKPAEDPVLDPGRRRRASAPSSCTRLSRGGVSARSSSTPASRPRRKPAFAVSSSPRRSRESPSIERSASRSGSRSTFRWAEASASRSYGWNGR